MVVVAAPIPFVDLSRQYQQIGGELEDRVLNVLRSGHYVSGSEVEAFEQEFASYCGTKFAVGVNSGTAALHLALLALGIGPGDEVITVSHSFFATAEAIVMTGADPVFVDIDPRTYQMDATKLEQALTPHSKAIIPVHLYGHPADMSTVIEFAVANDLAVVEDACQAHGARCEGKRIGSLGDVGCFSFYPSKNLGAPGEGGMAVTDSPDIARRLRTLRDHGQSQKYHHDCFGFNYRLPEIQAAALRVKLPYLDDWNAARQRIALTYNSQLGESAVIPPIYDQDRESVFHLYVVRSESRDQLAHDLAERGIATGLHYPIPIHLQPAFKDWGGGVGSLPFTEAAANEVLSLPMFPELSEPEVATVVDAITSLVPRSRSQW